MKWNLWGSGLSNLKLILWIGPLFFTLIFISIRLVIAAQYGDIVMNLLAYGVLIACVSLFFVCLSFGHNRIIQGCMILLSTALNTVIGLLWAASLAKAFWLLFLLALYTQIWDMYVLANLLRQRGNPPVTRRIKPLVLTSLLLWAMTAACFLSPFYAGTQPQTFTISDAQAENYDLVLYYPSPATINSTVCALAQEYNVTLSLPITESEFLPSHPNYATYVDAVRLCNQYNVNVEMWPLFDWEDGSYPSLSDVVRMPGLYAKFHNWTVQHNLTVKYILWDIEAGGETASHAPSPEWVNDLGLLGYTGTSQRYHQEEEDFWLESVDILRQLYHQSTLDGHIVRATTHPNLIVDYFDGDDSIQRNWRLPVRISEDMEYVSHMIYRGCDGPGNSSSAGIYEEVRACARVMNGPIAVCLGCINYEPYPDTPNVANDVRLALAAGATSIRLFQGNSWVYGTGEVAGSPDNLGYTNPPHGMAGLEELLMACRKGGTVTFYPDRNLKLSMSVGVLQDVVEDFTVI